MSSGRDTILGNIRKALGPRCESPHEPARVVPARGRVEPSLLVDTFIAEAERVDATVARVGNGRAVVAAVGGFLAAHGLPAILKMAPDPALRVFPWSGLQITEGAADAADMVSLTGAFAGIAETGTLMLLSGPESPTTLNFLPETHIVVLPAAAVVGSYEDAWARLRATADATTGDGFMPRAVNWITGPSRTADIEQTLMLGVHAPRRLHVIVTDEQDT